MPNPRLRSNEQIRLSPVRIVAADGEMLGVMPTDDAMRMAREAGMDLVEVSPNERPPICKIMDYGRHKYQQSRKQKQKHHERKTKEVRLRPKTDPHDREIKMNRAKRFLEAGDRVQFTMMFRGRERFHVQSGFEAFNLITESLADVAKMDRAPKVYGRRMTMVLAPAKAEGGGKPKPPKSPKPPKKPKTPAPQDSKTGDGSEAAAPPGEEASTPPAPVAPPPSPPVLDAAGEGSNAQQAP